MTAVIEASGLGKRYGRRWALSDCTLAVPAGRVVGLVGPNGAGKTTLLQLAAGLLTPDAGTIRVLGERPAVTPAQLARVGFVAQDAPVYARLSVEGHLRMGGWLNSGWDSELAERRISQLGLDPRQRAGSLSGGQRAQLALTLAAAKRPELLLLDEGPVMAQGLVSHRFPEVQAVDVVRARLGWHRSAPADLGGRLGGGGSARRGDDLVGKNPGAGYDRLRHHEKVAVAGSHLNVQWYETAVYVAVALILVGFCFLRIRPARSAERDLRSARPSPPALVLRS